MYYKYVWPSQTSSCLIWTKDLVILWYWDLLVWSRKTSKDQVFRGTRQTLSSVISKDLERPSLSRYSKHPCKWILNWSRKTSKDQVFRGVTSLSKWNIKLTDLERLFQSLSRLGNLVFRAKLDIYSIYTHAVVHLHGCARKQYWKNIESISDWHSRTVTVFVIWNTLEIFDTSCLSLYTKCSRLRLAL